MLFFTYLQRQLHTKSGKSFTGFICFCLFLLDVFFSVLFCIIILYGLIPFQCMKICIWLLGMHLYFSSENIAHLFAAVRKSKFQLINCTAAGPLKPPARQWTEKKCCCSPDFCLVCETKIQISCAIIYQICQVQNSQQLRIWQGKGISAFIIACVCAFVLCILWRTQHTNGAWKIFLR